MISSSHTLASMRFERAYHTSASSISRDARSWTLSATAAKLRSPVVSTRGAFSSAVPSCLRSSFSVFLPSFRSASSPAIVSVCSSATLSLFSFLMARCRGSSDRKLALPERRATVLTEFTSSAVLHALRRATFSRASVSSRGMSRRLPPSLCAAPCATLKTSSSTPRRPPGYTLARSGLTTYSHSSAGIASFTPLLGTGNGFWESPAPHNCISMPS